MKSFSRLTASANVFQHAAQHLTGKRIQKATPTPRVYQLPVAENQIPIVSPGRVANSDQPGEPLSQIANSADVSNTPYSDKRHIEMMWQAWNPKMSPENLEIAVTQIMKFMENPTATECDLSKLGIKALPIYIPFKEELSKRCTYLNLSGNRLEELPEKFLSLKNSLKHLDLSDNNPIKNLPDWCYGTRRRTISEKVRTVIKQPHQKELYESSLEELILDNTAITQLSKRIRNHVHLNKLSLREGSGLRDLPDEISHLHELKHLITAGTKISSIQRLSPTLTEFDASDSPLNTLPSNIAELKNLETLNLSKTRVKVLPAKFGTLPIKELDLSNNPQIKRLPNCIFSLKNLVNLNCAHNKNFKLEPEEVKKLEEKNVSIL